MPSPPILVVDALTLELAGKRVLDRVDLVAHRGEILALAGPNGSGKTSLLRCAAGIVRGASGSVRVAGHAMHPDAIDAKRALGYGVDPALLPDALTGAQALELFAGVRGLPRVPDATYVLADALAYTPWLPHEIATYSLGTRQKLGILLGLIGEPPLVLLDEPVNGLDPLSAHALKRHLRVLASRGAAVVLATHALDSAERYADRVVLLVDGRVAHAWDRDTLLALREDPQRTLESEMIATLESARANRD